MKVCTRCKVEKPDGDFGWKEKLKGRRASRCRRCHTEAVAESQAKNPKKYKRQNRDSLDRLRKRNVVFIYEYLLNHPCTKCNESNPIVLEFDHLQDKRNNVSSMIRVCSIETLKTEIAKCQVLCSNCHKMKTAEEQNWLMWGLHETEKARCKIL